MFRQATPIVTIITATKASSRQYVIFGTGVNDHFGRWSEWPLWKRPEFRAARARPGISVNPQTEFVDTG